MGLLDIIRSKREEPEMEKDETVYEIPLEDLSDWVSEQFGQEVISNRNWLKKMISKIESDFSQTKDILLELEKADLGDNERVFTVAKMTKNSYVKHALSVIDKFSFTTDSYSEIKAVNSRIKSTLKELNKMSPKQSVLVRKYFDNESSRLANVLRKIDHASKEIRDFIESDDNALEKNELLNKNIENLNYLINNSQELKSNEKEIREEINDLDESRKGLTKKEDNLLKSSEWIKLKSYEDIIKNGRTELKAFESRSNEMLNSVKRPLKKLWHLQERKQSFPSNPFSEYVLDNREDMLEQMIRETESFASEGKIILKPKETEKLKKVAEFLKNEIPRIKKNYILLKEASKNAKNKIAQSDFYKEKDSVSKELKDIEQKHESKWSELNSLIQERKKIESDIQEMKKKIETQVLESGKTLKLII